MRRRAMAMLLVLATLSGACGEQGAEDPGDAGAEEAEVLDEGDFSVVLEEAPEDLTHVRQLLVDYEMPTIADDLNDLLSLPEDIPIVFSSEGADIGPHYDPETNEIVMPYAFVEQAITTFEELEYGDESELAAASASEFVVYHEVGHALIANLDLPVAGREEDAVDGLAAVILTETYEEGQESVLAAADWFAAAADGRGEALLEDFAGEHSLDEQRYFQLLCWVYGSDPDAYGWLVTDEHLPEERADRCPDEYERNLDAWTQLLGDRLKV